MQDLRQLNAAFAIDMRCWYNPVSQFVAEIFKRF
jgi:hypothetical protein